MADTDRHPRPRWLSERIVGLALRVLPRGEIRRRYERELIAELHALPAERQLRFALGTLFSAHALRNAAVGRASLDGAGTDVGARRIRWRCIVSHSWRTVTTEEGDVWSVCRRCGKYGDPPQDVLGSMTQLINWW